MKLQRPKHNVFNFSLSVSHKKNLIIILASGKTWYYKTLHLVFQNGNLYVLFTFYISY